MKPLILAAVLVATLSAKDHRWQMGMVRDAATTSTYHGQLGDSTPLNIVTQTIVIDGEAYTAPLGQFYQEYTAQRILNWRWSKDSVLTVNTPVKFDVEKRKLFLADDNGKQFELDVVKQVQREAK